MTFFSFIFLSVLSISLEAYAQETVYDFRFESLTSNQPIMLNAYRGKVMLIVNTASHCGWHDQLKGLEALYQKYKNQGFIVIGVPSHDFGGQEFARPHEIADFCLMNYGVHFPMTMPSVVKGDKAHPFYAWAKNQLGFASAPRWNFHKYLINRQGRLVDYFYSFTPPEASRVVKIIERLLEE